MVQQLYPRSIETASTLLQRVRPSWFSSSAEIAEKDTSFQFLRRPFFDFDELHPMVCSGDLQGFKDAL